jgi:DNA-binding response OmpR family regulator
MFHDDLLQFTKAQFCVLHALIRAHGRVLPYNFLADRLEDCTGQESEFNVLMVHICRVRKLLKPHGVKIINLHGVGYSISRWDFEVMHPAEMEVAA